VTTTSLIVDASIGVKWLFEEDYFEQARKLLDDVYVRIVPDIFYTEMTNAIWKRARRGDLDLAEGVAALGALMGIPTEQHESRSLLPHALDIACAHDRTMYDSVYLALATREKKTLVTADRRFFNAVSGTSFGKTVSWIEDAV
jgi:predicted nucleic acid-binding protein